jgi:hypothetical protein
MSEPYKVRLVIWSKIGAVYEFVAFYRDLVSCQRDTIDDRYPEKPSPQVVEDLMVVMTPEAVGEVFGREAERLWPECGSRDYHVYFKEYTSYLTSPAARLKHLVTTPLNTD